VLLSLTDESLKWWTHFSITKSIHYVKTTIPVGKIAKKSSM